jgi:hypothetical protein
MNTSEMATCPYNPNHCFAKYKLFPHLQRCKDAKRGRKLYQCKKDIMVMFFIEDKPIHYATCSYCSGSAKLNETKNSELEKLRKKKVEMKIANEHLNSIEFNLNITKEESILDFNVNEFICDNTNFLEGLDIQAISEASDVKNSKNETILY